MKEPAILGIVQKDGSIRTCDRLPGQGAAGNYDVLIEWKRISGQGRPQHGPDLLQGRYADPKHPLLHAALTAAANNLPPFQLTDDVPVETVRDR